MVDLFEAEQMVWISSQHLVKRLYLPPLTAAAIWSNQLDIDRAVPDQCLFDVEIEPQRLTCVRPCTDGG